MSTFRQRAFQGGPGNPFLGSAVGRIIVVTVAVFFLQILAPVVNLWLALTPSLVIERFYLWQPVTYMFLHGGFWHLFFNLIVLYFMGNMVESVWGSRRFLRYYLACGVGGGLLHILLQQDAAVVGASGAIFGLYLAAAMLFPDSYVYLYFLVPVKVKYFVAGLAVLQLANGIAGPSGVAYFAHMGGMATGLLFFRREIAQRFGLASRSRSWRPPRRRRPAGRAQAGDNIDSILDKISAKGYDNLTPTEKRILDNYSRQRQNPSE